MTVEEVIENVKELCIRFSAREVYLFGSRAKGTYLDRSDIDIAVSGVDAFEDLLEAVEELPTLYTIDLLDIDRCRNLYLLEDIKTYGRKIYEKIL